MFSSCNFIFANKNGIMEKISKAMDKAYSYESDGELNITAYYNKKEMNIKGITKQIFSKEKNSDLYFYSNNIIDIEHNNSKTSTKVIEAYNDGEYFFSHFSNKTGNRLRSSHTEKEFLEYYEKSSKSGDLLDGYSEISSSKNDDGNYEVLLTKYDSNKIKEINLIYGFPLKANGASIVDLIVTILADSKYLVKEIDIQYIFSEDDHSGEQKITYSNYGSAEKNLSDINTKFYTSVDDARAVPLLSSLLNDVAQAESGKVSSSSTFETMLMGVKNKSEETYNVSYGYDDGKFEYDVKAEIGEKKHSIEYKDGIYIKDEQKNESYTEFEAKAFVKSLIDPYSYSSMSVRQVNVNRNDDGTTSYTFEVKPENTALEEMLKQTFSSLSAGYMNAEVEINFVVKDDELTSITYLINSTGQINYRNSTYMIGIDITTKLVFK